MMDDKKKAQKVHKRHKNTQMYYHFSAKETLQTFLFYFKTHVHICVSTLYEGKILFYK